MKGLNRSMTFHTAIAATLLVGLAACGSHYSEGERTGTVVKLSEKGLFCKSWEGEIASGGMIATSDGHGGSAMQANVLDFNVSPYQVKAVQAALESGKPVRIHYHQWWTAPFCIENDHVVDAVEPLQ
jgi:hypothetical protein